MEDILASIRRIIADDQEAPKPAFSSAPFPAAAPHDARQPEPEDILDLADIAAEEPPEEFAGLSVLGQDDPVLEQDHPMLEQDDSVLEQDDPVPAEAGPVNRPRPDEISESLARFLADSENTPLRERPPAPSSSPPPAVEPAPEPALEPPPPLQAASRAPPASPQPTPANPGPQDRLISTGTDAAVSQAFNMLAHTVLSRNAMTLEDLVKDLMRPMLKDWLDDNLPSLVERLVRAEIERVARGHR